MIRGLGRMESVSADREMLRAATRVYGHPVDEAELARLAEPYGTWAGYLGALPARQLLSGDPAAVPAQPARPTRSRGGRLC